MVDSQPDNVVEVESLDSLIDVAASIGGPVVDDTEIRYAEGAGVVSVGGLEIAMPILAEFEYYDSGAEGRNITVPPSWPTLSAAQLDSNRDPSGDPTIGLAVFAQVPLVTDAESRAQLFEDAFMVGRHQNSEVIHESEVTNVDTGVTCWTQVRYGRVREVFDPEHHTVVLFAGPGIASSGMIIWAPGSFTEIPAVTGDLVESVCGSRPDGL